MYLAGNHRWVPRVSCSISQYLGTVSCSFNQSFSQLYNQSFHQPVSQLQADKGGLYYHLPSMHCGQTILSTAEPLRVTYFKVSLHRKNKGTREIQKIIHYTPHKLYQSHNRRISQDNYRCPSQV